MSMHSKQPPQRRIDGQGPVGVETLAAGRATDVASWRCITTSRPQPGQLGSPRRVLQALDGDQIRGDQHLAEDPIEGRVSAASGRSQCS